LRAAHDGYEGGRVAPTGAQTSNRFTFHDSTDSACAFFSLAAICAGKENELHHKQTGDPWKSDKDGKQWVDTDRHPEILRK
jgi:hypothetical protein